MSSTREEYQIKKMYSHPSSRALRTAPKPTAGAKEMQTIRSRHQIENTKFGREANDARRELENEHKKRRAATPYASFHNQEHVESDELENSWKAKKKALDTRQAGELDAAMKRHMPKE
jgi:Skp family chaperone for outer membrane proteins